MRRPRQAPLERVLCRLGYLFTSRIHVREAQALQDALLVNGLEYQIWRRDGCYLASVKVELQPNSRTLDATSHPRYEPADKSLWF